MNSAGFTPQSAIGEAEDSWVLDRARLTVYHFLSLAAVSPQSESWPDLLDSSCQELAVAAAEVIREAPETRPDALAPGEMTVDALNLMPLVSFLEAPRESLIEEYDRVFGLLISQECPPYETEYCPQTFSVHRSHQLADIAGYYRAFGLEPSSQRPERSDHIVLELEFMAWLIGKTLYASQHGDGDHVRLCREAQVSFVRDHFAWWTPAFALALRRKADGPAVDECLTSPPKSYLGSYGAFLAAFVPAERGALGIAPPTKLAAPTVAEAEGEAGCEGCLSSDQAPE
jgi:TorA maturation chaperone TorD